ncbi:ribosomal protein S18-alanine N-acetyltransferase [Enterococcus sp. 5H]|uniref:ribosomal protein S18-alanine N-acetyltransferase n=1 Tax=Enterococcus sp. 5H TaxID=1229490 RepID=UPI002302F699|nr:ribosomal protein S18-alanine N-acetyltransferase [Enterococcus sp. 5H]
MYYSKEDLIEEDLAEIVWQLSSAAYSHGSPWSKEQFQVDIEQDTSRYLVMLKNKQLLGFISYHLVLDEAEFTHVVTHYEYQQQGLGSQLLDQVIQELSQKGVTKVFLEVRIANLGARHLYRKKGFKEINLRKNYYHHPVEDGIVMCLEIKEVSQ